MCFPFSYGLLIGTVCLSQYIWGERERERMFLWFHFRVLAKYCASILSFLQFRLGGKGADFFLIADKTPTPHPQAHFVQLPPTHFLWLPFSSVRFGWALPLFSFLLNIQAWLLKKRKKKSLGWKLKNQQRKCWLTSFLMWGDIPPPHDHYCSLVGLAPLNVFFLLSRSHIFPLSRLPCGSVHFAVCGRKTSDSRWQ